MWCRFLTFCVLVSFILFVVASCIYGRPSFHLFFHRCCGEDIENDQVIFENFGNNFLKERLVGGDIIEADSDTVFENEDVGRIADETKQVSMNDPEVKKWITDANVSDSDNSDTAAEDLKEDELHDVNKDKEDNELNVTNYESSQKNVEDIIASTLSDATVEGQTGKKIYDAITDQENKEKNKVVTRSYERLDKEAEEITDTANNSEYLNVHDTKHKQMALTI